MGRGGKKKNAQAQIAELEIEKRNGMMRAIVAFVGLAVLIACKLALAGAGVAWVQTNVANIGIFVIALVAAGVAGLGARDWMRARERIAQLRSKTKK